MVTRRLLQVDAEADVDGSRGQTFFVVAGLEAKFSSHHVKPGLADGESFETGGNFEISAEYRDWIRGKGVLFELRLGISDLFGFKRLFGPGELEGNQKLVGGSITIGVEAGLKLSL